MRLASVPFADGRVWVDPEARHPRHALTLLGSSARARVALQGAMSAVLAVGAARVLPTTATLPVWPYGSGDWLTELIRDVVPGFVLDGIVAPRQEQRLRLLLAGRARGSSVAVKVVADAATSLHEAEVLRRLTEAPIPAVATPRLVDHGTTAVDGVTVHVIATELHQGWQRPAFRPAVLRTFQDELAERLAGLPRPDDVPEDWVPNHLDVAPWNLRRTDRGYVLFDWESCGFAPRGTDLAHFQCCVAALGRGRAPSMSPEVRTFLLQRMEKRLADEPGALDLRLQDLLRRPEEEGAGCASS